MARLENYELLYKKNEIKIEKVNLDPIKHTSWIRERSLTDINDYEFLYDLNAQFFIDNYTVTIIAILSYLLNREIRIESPKDFEFLYAKERLNKDKIKKITSMVGPFQTNKYLFITYFKIFIFTKTETIYNFTIGACYTFLGGDQKMNIGDADINHRI